MENWLAFNLLALLLTVALIFSYTVVYSTDLATTVYFEQQYCLELCRSEEKKTQSIIFISFQIRFRNSSE